MGVEVFYYGLPPDFRRAGFLFACQPRRESSMQRLVVFVLMIVSGLVILASCAPDPRNQADAYKTTVLADQAAADQAEARAARTLQDNQAASDRAATEAARVAGWNRFILVASIAGCVGAAFLAIGCSWAAIGAGRSVAMAAERKAAVITIHLDESTRTFPLAMVYLGAGRFSLANPNTQNVLMLDTRQPGDRQAIRAAGAVMLAGAVAREARRSNQPEGVAVITSGVSHD